MKTIQVVGYWILFFTTCALVGIGGLYAAEIQSLAKPQSILTYKPDMVGGIPVRPGQSPWQVALVYTDTANLVDAVFCGGTLLSSTWVLTAAHCFYDQKTCAKYPKQRYYIAYGSTDLGRKVSLVAAKEIFEPKGYLCKEKNNDIALIELEEPITNVMPITLPSPQDATKYLNVGKELMTAGWGLTEENGYKSRELIEVKVPLKDEDTCKAVHAQFPKNALCAGALGKDACNGDSGGPLYVRTASNGAAAIQLGIVSFGEGCGREKIPGVYTRLSDYLAWIESTIKPKPCTPEQIAKNFC